LVARAAAVAADETVPAAVRGRAAGLCRTLAFQLASDEELCSTCVRAANACLKTFLVVHDLAITAVELAPEPDRVVAPLLRLCARAHAAGHRATAVVVMFRLVELPAFQGNAPAAWLVDTRGLEHEAGYWLRHLVGRWVARFGGRNEGVIRERQDELFLQMRIPIQEVLRLHAAEPTAAAWKGLARRRHELQPGPLAVSFGDRSDDAVSTLREALARRHDPGANVALKGLADGALPVTAVVRQDMSRRDHPVLEALGATVLVLAFVATAPGALATFAVEHALGVPLELGQRWTFALAASVLAAVAFCLRSRAGWDGFGQYMLLSAATAAVLFVTRFGFHADWAASFFSAYIP
jgi:hypothetical protein